MEYSQRISSLYRIFFISMLIRYNNKQPLSLEDLKEELNKMIEEQIEMVKEHALSKNAIDTQLFKL
jgi:hypothetical protein